MALSFVIIAYNAAKYLSGLLDDLLNQDYSLEEIEIILVDSDSTDATRRIMSDFQRSHSSLFKRVLVLDNLMRVLPCGWNVALGTVTTDFILRVDAHVKLPTDFISRNIECMRSGKDICGGRVLSILENDTAWSRTLLAAENSMFGGGLTYFRRGESPRYTKTLAFAMYRTRIFKAVGPYNERLVRTEDNDMHYRMRRAGFKFFFDPEIVSYRYCRNSLRKLLRQKYLNGYWIGRTVGISPACLSVAYFAPFGLIISFLVCAVLTCLGWAFPLVALSLVYLLLLAASYAPVISRREFTGTSLFLPLFLMLLHLAYGVGIFVGLVKMPFAKK